MDRQQLKQRVLEIWYSKLANAELRTKYWQSMGQQRATAICTEEILRLRGEINQIEENKWPFSKLLLLSRS